MKLKCQKSLLYTFLFFLPYIAFNCSGCDKECREVLPYERGFSFRLLDKGSGENLIALWGAKYNSEEVTLKQENGNHASFLSVGGNGKIGFLILDYPLEPIGENHVKIYFLELPDPSGTPGREDIDTIKFEYAFKENDCPAIWYDYFEIYYNDSLYHEGDFIQYIEFYKN